MGGEKKTIEYLLEWCRSKIPPQKKYVLNNNVLRSERLEKRQRKTSAKNLARMRKVFLEELHQDSESKQLLDPKKFVLFCKSDLTEKQFVDSILKSDTSYTISL